MKSFTGTGYVKYNLPQAGVNHECIRSRAYQKMLILSEHN